MLLRPRIPSLRLRIPRRAPHRPHTTQPQPQPYPLDALDAPLRRAGTAKPPSPPTATQATPPPPPDTTSPARVIFSASLSGPTYRPTAPADGTRPEEPDNCCMSGCVNCVWDAYREEVEAWAGRRESPGDEGEDLWEGVPVGIREFMRTEKRLKGKGKEKERRGGG